MNKNISLKKFVLINFQLYNTFTEIASHRPLERSPVYDVLKQVLEQFCQQIPSIVDETRQSLGLCQQNVCFEFDNQTIINQFKDDQEKIKAEWLKQAKKKKWGEEEELASKQESRDKMAPLLKQELAKQLNDFENRKGDLMALERLRNQQSACLEYFELLQRKKPLTDQEIEGKRVMIKGHLKIADQQLKLKFEEQLVTFQQEKKRLEELRQAEENNPNKKKDKKKGKKQDEVEKVQEIPELDLSFLDHQNFQNILDTVKCALDRQAKLVFLVLSYDQPTGSKVELSSLKFLHELLQKKFEQKVYFLDSCIIPDFDEKIENDFYQDNSLIILENIFFHKEETGFYLDEQKNLIKLDYDEKQQFIETLNKYSQIYVIQDSCNLDSQYTSINHIKAETNVLGIDTAQNLSLISQFIINETQPFLAIIGGDVSSDKLMAIITLINFCSEIHVVGKLGLYFALIQGQLSESLQSLVQNSQINQVQIKIIQHLSQNPKIKTVKDFAFTNKYDQLTRNQLTSIEENQFIANLVQLQGYHEFLIKESPSNFANQVIFELGPDTMSGLIDAVQQNLKILWIDSVSPYQQSQIFDAQTQNLGSVEYLELFNKSNLDLSIFIKELQQQKKNLILEEGINHLFHNDHLILLLGNEINELLQNIAIDSSKQETNLQLENTHVEEEQEQQLEDDEQQQNQVIKNNFDLLSDFNSLNDKFILYLLSGTFIPGLDNIDSYNKIPKRNKLDEFDFINSI